MRRPAPPLGVAAQPAWAARVCPPLLAPPPGVRLHPPRPQCSQCPSLRQGRGPAGAWPRVLAAPASTGWRGRLREKGFAAGGRGHAGRLLLSFSKSPSRTWCRETARRSSRPGGRPRPTRSSTCPSSSSTPAGRRSLTAASPMTSAWRAPSREAAHGASLVLVASAVGDVCCPLAGSASCWQDVRVPGSAWAWTATHRLARASHGSFLSS